MTGPPAGVLSALHLAAPPRTLIDILRETTARHPDASALDDGDGALSYRELMARVIRVAARLHVAGVRRGDRVGVRMPSGTRELYVTILAILAAGAAYVPVDADDPDERADLVFGEAGVVGVVTGGGEYEPSAGGVLRGDDSLLEVTEAPADHSIVFSHSAPRPLFEGSPPHPSTSSTPVIHAPGLGDDAWIIFTSGSTGTPKGVAVSHRSAAAFVDAEAGLFLPDEPLAPGDRVLAGLSVAFDAS